MMPVQQLRYKAIGSAEHAVQPYRGRQGDRLL